MDFLFRNPLKISKNMMGNRSNKLNLMDLTISKLNLCKPLEFLIAGISFKMDFFIIMQAVQIGLECQQSFIKEKPKFSTIILILFSMIEY